MTQLPWKCKECKKKFATEKECEDHVCWEEGKTKTPAPEAATGNDTPVAIVEGPPPEAAPERPGIYQISDETYHHGPGVSRSDLWKLFDKTPHHMRYGVRKETDPQKFGSAVHASVLEPGTYEDRYMRGPDDRRGKKWEAAEKIAADVGKVCITSKEFDDALRIRDIAHRHPIVRTLTRGAPAVEQSYYWIDEATGELCKVRVDIHSHEVRIAADLKSAASGSARDFQSSIAKYGYHLQDYMYPLGIAEASEQKFTVDGFVFIVVEKESPNPITIFELEAIDREEAAATYRIALDNYHKCMQWERRERMANEAAASNGKKHLTPDKLELHVEKTCWPGYPTGVQKINLPAWGYRVRPVK